MIKLRFRKPIVELVNILTIILEKVYCQLSHSPMKSHRKCAMTSQRDVCSDLEKSLIEIALIFSAGLLRYNLV